MANVYQDPFMRQVLARVVRSKMDLCGFTYKELCTVIKDKFDIEHNPDTLRNKVSTGALGTQMFFFMMLAMDVEQVDMDEINRLYQKLSQ